MTLALLGAGVMGEIVLAGILRAGMSPDDVLVTERRAGRRAEIEERYGVRVVSNIDAVAAADVVVLVVKPQDVTGVLDEIGPSLTDGALVVSIAAGVETATLEAHLPEGVPVVRVMPNTAAAVGEGMAAVSPGSSATEAHLSRVEDLLTPIGRVVVVEERYQDAVTAISGSGPAYVMLVAEAMIEAGVQVGLSRDVAAQLVVQTMYGSAKLLSETGEHPAVLRENVTSPAGTTAAGLRALEDHGVRAAFMAAVEAARDRSRALAEAARTI